MKSTEDHTNPATASDTDPKSPSARSRFYEDRLKAFLVVCVEKSTLNGAAKDVNYSTVFAMACGDEKALCRAQEFVGSDWLSVYSMNASVLYDEMRVEEDPQPDVGWAADWVR